MATPQDFPTQMPFATNYFFLITLALFAATHRRLAHRSLLRMARLAAERDFIEIVNKAMWDIRWAPTGLDCVAESRAGVYVWTKLAADAWLCFQCSAYTWGAFPYQVLRRGCEQRTAGP